ncbi:MAG TPA: hypothetical protein VEG44_07290 [Candidatus Acidoferrales bacterium]|nr:hypothetical protein [Candidatus Acidoferrales bacterium]
MLEGYRAAIRRAKDFLYLENQYFANDAIVAELLQALRRHRELQLILVINQTPNIPLYQQLQNKSIKRLGLDVTRHVIDHPRIGVLTAGPQITPPTKVNCNRVTFTARLALWMTCG